MFENAVKQTNGSALVPELASPETTMVETFDYNTLPTTLQDELKQDAEEVRNHIANSFTSAVNAGKKLSDVRDKLAHNKVGGFTGWCDHEGIGRRNAYNYINLFETYGNRAEFAQLNAPVSALLLLAGNNVPDEARDELLERAGTERITLKTAKEIKAKWTPPTSKQIISALAQSTTVLRVICNARHKKPHTPDGGLFVNGQRVGVWEVEPTRQLFNVTLLNDAKNSVDWPTIENAAGFQTENALQRAIDTWLMERFVGIKQRHQYLCSLTENRRDITSDDVFLNMLPLPFKTKTLRSVVASMRYAMQQRIAQNEAIENNLERLRTEYPQWTFRHGNRHYIAERNGYEPIVSTSANLVEYQINSIKLAEMESRDEIVEGEIVEPAQTKKPSKRRGVSDERMFNTLRNVVVSGHLENNHDYIDRVLAGETVKPKGVEINLAWIVRYVSKAHQNPADKGRVEDCLDIIHGELLAAAADNDDPAIEDAAASDDVDGVKFLYKIVPLSNGVLEIERFIIQDDSNGTHIFVNEHGVQRRIDTARIDNGDYNNVWSSVEACVHHNQAEIAREIEALHAKSGQYGRCLKVKFAITDRAGHQRIK